MDFIFVHINKTAGTSIEHALGLPFQHKTARQFINEIGLETWRTTFTFAVVRNPWDKVVSHYHYRVETNRLDPGDDPIQFGDWVREAYGKRKILQQPEDVHAACRLVDGFRWQDCR